MLVNIFGSDLRPRRPNPPPRRQRPPETTPPPSRPDHGPASPSHARRRLSGHDHDDRATAALLRPDSLQLRADRARSGPSLSARCIRSDPIGRRSRCQPARPRPQRRRARRHDPALGGGDGELLIGIARSWSTRPNAPGDGDGDRRARDCSGRSARRVPTGQGDGHWRRSHWCIREATMSIPAHDLSTLGLGRESPGPALVHGVPDVVVDRDGDGGVTGDPPQRLGIDQPDVLELTGERSAAL